MCFSLSAFKIYDLVNTVYGTGYVAAIRETDYVVLLTHWKLAQGQSPTLYLEEKAMRLVLLTVDEEIHVSYVCALNRSDV